MIAAISGFLFNRFSFFLIVMVIIVVLVGAGRLIWNRYTIGGLLLLALGIGLWSLHDKWVKADRVATAAPYIESIKKANDEAAAKLAAETAKTDAATKALKEFSTQQGKTDVKNTQTITALNTKLRTTRLRDPYQTRCSSSGPSSPTPASTVDSTVDGTRSSGSVSAEFDGFLKQRAQRTDEINNAYIACRADAYKVREVLK